MSSAADDFVGLVSRMRAAQRHWFKFHDMGSLEESKKLEREVDRWIERATGPKAAPTLFDARFDAREGGKP
jgi:hypothetical protein